MPTSAGVRGLGAPSELSAPDAPGVAPAGGEPSCEREGGPYHGCGCEKGGCFWYAKNEVEKTAVGMEYATNVSGPRVSSFECAGTEELCAHSIDQLAMGAGTESNQYTIETGFDVDRGLFTSSPESPHFFIVVNPDKYGNASCYIDHEGEDEGCKHFIPAAEAKITPNETVKPSISKITLGVKYLAECFPKATSGCWWIWAGTQWIGYVPASFWGGHFTQGTSEANYGEVFDDEEKPTSEMGDGYPGRYAQATTMSAPLVIINENKEEIPGLHEEVTNSSLYSIGDVNETGWHFGGPGADPVPTVTTEESSVTPPSSVELKGSVDPNNLETHYYFEYGPTTSYGSVSSTESAGSGVEPVSVSATITGLKPGTTYHYRLVAYNADGYGYGADSTFTTPWWYVQSTQNPHGGEETDEFRGVSCWSATGCDAVGINSTPENEIIGLVERWNGTSWEVQSTPKSTGASEDNLEAVSCLSASECEATGYAELAKGKHVTLAEQWNGTAWSVQSTPTTEGNDSTLVSVSCVSGSECIASGFSTSSGKHKALVRLWNGKEWTVQTTAKLPKEDKESWFASVSCPKRKRLHRSRQG